MALITYASDANGACVPGLFPSGIGVLPVSNPGLVSSETGVLDIPSFFSCMITVPPLTLKKSVGTRKGYLSWVGFLADKTHAGGFRVGARVVGRGTLSGGQVMGPRVGNTFHIRCVASQTKSLPLCHPERSEGSLSG